MIKWVRPRRRDRRPLAGPYTFVWQSSWNALLLQLAALSLLILAVLPAPAGLGTEGLRALGIFAVCFFLWITGALPFAITGLLAICLISLYKVMPANEAFALFGNTAVFFILGAFILAAAIMKSGLSKRAALWLLARFGRGPGTLLFGVFFISWSLSLFMAEHAVAAALLPVILELAVAAEQAGPRGKHYAKGLLLAMAWGTVIGGTGTLLGGARAPLAIGILRRTTEESLGFFEWSKAVFPVTLALLPIGTLLLLLRFGRAGVPIEQLRDALRHQTADLGAMTSTEKGIGAVFLLTVTAWILLGHEVGLATIAILSAVSLFVFRLVSWQETEEYVNWGILLMYGGAVALGTAMSQSGAAGWVAHYLLNWATADPLVLLAVLAVIAAALTEGMSSAAVVALLLPIGIGLSEEAGLAATPVALCVGLAAGLVFLFPTGAPAVALVLTSRRLTISDMVSFGFAMSIVSLVLIFLLIRFWWPFIGILP